MTSVAASPFRLADLRVGQEFSFRYNIDNEQMAAFAALSGDRNPLHAETEFARARGFTDRVVYGAIHVAMISRLVGMECPGRNAVFTRLDIAFHKPLYVDQEAHLAARIDTISAAVGAMVLDIVITSGGVTIAKATAEALLVEPDSGA